MKQFYLLFGALLLCNVLSAQTITIKDKATLQPLPALIVSADGARVTQANEEGIADLSSFKSTDSIEIIFSGFQTMHTSYNDLADNAEVLLNVSSHMLGEVVVSANRFDDEVSEIAQPVEVISSHEIAFDNPATSADVMQNTGNVLVQKSQQGGGSPIIRGFETNKVLLVVDGVRMNNAIYRGGHLQNIITLDNAIMERVEVLYGPGSVMYGSDALGGVMHFITKNPTLSTTTTPLYRGNAFARYASAAEEKTFHADISIGGQKFGSLTSFTYSDFGDLTQGSNRDDEYPDFGKRLFYVERVGDADTSIVNPDPDKQVGSGYTQYDFLQKFSFQQKENVLHQLNFQYSTSTDVPRYDRLTETANGLPRFGQWYYGPQERLFAAYTLALKGDSFYDEARVMVGYQGIEESRHDRRFNMEFLNHRTEQLDIFTLNADFSKEAGKSLWRYGLEAVTNHVNSVANKESVLDGEILPQTTRYPDGGSDVFSGALYVTDKFSVSDVFSITPGVRLSYNNLTSVFEDKTFFPFPFDEVKQTNTILSGSLGLVWNGNSGWRFSMLGATGFRAPNVDDLAKVFESVQGKVVVPNPDLGPEKTYSIDIGLSKTVKNKFTVGADVYYTLYRDAITTQPGTFNGQSTIIYDDSLSQVTMNVNARSAFLYGGNAYVSVNLTKSLSIYSTINYTYGRIEEETGDKPLDHIPPLFGKTSLNLSAKKFRGELYALYNGWKKLKDYNLDGEDNLPFATPEGMPAWMTLNVRASYQIVPAIMLQVGMDNILDENYRVFASNISAAGRNLIVAVRGSF